METDAARDAILGIWTLISYQDRESQQERWVHTFGDNPGGLALYHSSGTLAMQVFPDTSSASPVHEMHVAYLGRFNVREARQKGDRFSGVLEHHIERASYPDLLAEDVARPFELWGNELVLGDGRTWVRRFQRVL